MPTEIFMACPSCEERITLYTVLGRSASLRATPREVTCPACAATFQLEGEVRVDEGEQSGRITVRE